MFRSLLHFSPTVRKAIAIITLVAFALLCYKHICDDRQQQAEIEILKAKIAELETTQQIVRIPHNPSIAAAVPQEKAPQTPPTKAKKESIKTSRHNAVPRPESPEQATAEHPSATTATEVPATVQPHPETPTPTVPLSYSRKFESPRLIDLNTADSATLVRIPGIGAATSGAILRYRARLGGFYSSEQLPECIRWADAERITSWQKEWLVADTTRITPMAVNRLEFKELLRHPYLEYRQVCALMDLKRKRGYIGSLEEIGRLPEFDANDIARLRPYLDFSTQ